jgi:UPF0716 family protein affecting phage T7 exclusion
MDAIVAGGLAVYAIIGIVGFLVAVLILRAVLGTGLLIKQGEEMLALMKKIADKS